MHAYILHMYFVIWTQSVLHVSLKYQINTEIYLEW